MLALQSHLEGKAKQFWLTSKADKKATYGLALNALKLRFPTRNGGLREWAAKARAVAEINELTKNIYE